MRLPSKRTVKTAAACALGAAVLLFPGSVLMLAAGAALGFWGWNSETMNHSEEGNGMKIVVVRSPKAFRGILKAIFGLR